jgi:hypothetical protein
MLRDEAYVPFDIDFSAEDGEAKVITVLMVGIDSMYGSDWVVRTSRIGHSWDT